MKDNLKSLQSLILLFAISITTYAGEQYYMVPGELEPGSGTGYKDDTLYFPDMQFPLQGDAYLNSQVHRPGGQKPGNQCAEINYKYPWRDNYCESRQWSMPMCPAGHGHQGQDIRPATCKRDTHWAVAVEDGLIAQVGKYSVTLQTPKGTMYRYLHLNMNKLAIRESDRVKKGQKIGLVSNYFNGTPTTIHLHFEAKDTIQYKGNSQRLFLPVYSSLVHSYKNFPRTATTTDFGR